MLLYLHYFIWKHLKYSFFAPYCNMPYRYSPNPYSVKIDWNRWSIKIKCTMVLKKCSWRSPMCKGTHLWTSDKWSQQQSTEQILGKLHLDHNDSQEWQPRSWLFQKSRHKPAQTLSSPFIFSPKETQCVSLHQHSILLPSFPLVRMLLALIDHLAVLQLSTYDNLNDSLFLSLACGSLQVNRT